MSAGEELVQVAWAADQVEAGLIQGLLENEGIPSVQQQVGINGPQVGIGLLNPAGGARRVMVFEDRADEARALLEQTLVENEREAPEPVNAEYLAEARGRGPRNYNLIGAYARIYFWSFAVFALAFGIFMLLRAV
jgi:Putative prokaryotic signal transducing protein